MSGKINGKKLYLSTSAVIIYGPYYNRKNCNNFTALKVATNKSKVLKKKKTFSHDHFIMCYKLGICTTSYKINVLFKRLVLTPYIQN